MQATLQRSIPCQAVGSHLPDSSRRLTVVETVASSRPKQARPKPPSLPSSEEADDGQVALAAQDVFRKHFERQFVPLPRQCHDTSEPDSAGSEFEGFSDESESDEGENEGEEGNDGQDLDVEVIDHSVPRTNTPTMSKEALKSFMSARPPSSTSPKCQRLSADPQSSLAAASAMPEDSATFLANDLALQRLISESHLLLPQQTDHVIFSRPASDPAKSLFAAGRARRKATELRAQALGAKGGSLYARPRAVIGVARKMDLAERAREAARRREARESGIVLERKAGKSSKPRAGRRKR